MKIAVGEKQKTKLKKNKPKSTKLKSSKKKTKLGRRVSTETERKSARKAASSGKPKFTRTTPEEAQQALEEEAAGEFWKPKEGRNKILMLPSLEEWGTNYPWVETAGHYTGGKDAMASLGLDNRPDEIPMVVGCAKFHEKRPCELDNFVSKLFKSKHARDKKLAKALKMTFGAYANIVDLSAPKVARPYRFGKTIRNQLLAAIEDGDHFYDPDALMMIIIRKIKKGKQVWEVDYDVRVQSKKVIGKLKKRWFKTMTDLSQYRPDVPGPDEAQEVIDMLLAAADAESDGDVGMGDDDFDDTDDDDVPF